MPPPIPKTRVLLADDHAIVVDGLSSLLKDDFDLVGVARDGQSLVNMATGLRPDVIVTDITMPVMSGLDAVKRLRQEGVPSKVVILTMHDHPQLAAGAFRAGASGYLLKNAAGDELIQAIREVMAGRVYVSPMIAGHVMAALTSSAMSSAPAKNGLTQRQIEVLQLIAKGKRMKEIGVALGLSRRTVESHKYEMMKALGLNSTAELVQYAIRNGFLASEPSQTSVR